jgi:large subunit ribosomal protein L21
MYAIIEESGSQRKVTQGEEIHVDLLEAGQAKVGQAIKFDRVLVVGDEGGSAKLGQPYVAGATVTGEVVEPVAMGQKVIKVMYREKKTWRKTQGHRQRYTTVKITAINA